MEIHATEKGLRLFEAYWEMFFWNFAVRAGYNMTGVNRSFNDRGEPRPYDLVFDYSLPQTDGAHLCMLTQLITLLRLFYPERVSSHLAEQALFYMPSIHELGELNGGDVADDGRRDEKTKDAEETAFALSFFERACDDYGSRLVMKNNVGDFFKHFTAADTNEACFYKCLDKCEAILSNLVYESIYYDENDHSRLVEPDCPGAIWRGGSVDYKKKTFKDGISRKEEFCLAHVGESDLPSENWFFGFLMYNYQNPWASLFAEIIQSGFKKIHGYEMDWINTCFDWNTENGNIAKIDIPTFH